MSVFAKAEHRFLPIPEDERIATLPFLMACRTGILPFLEAMGKAFILTRSDVSGNIEKLQKKYDMDSEKFTTINDMLEEEVASKSTNLASLGGLWLKRGSLLCCRFKERNLTAYSASIIEDDHGEGDRNKQKGLEYVSLLLQLIIEDHNSGKQTEDLGIASRKAYEQTLKQYHSWVVQKLVSVGSRAMPSTTNFIKYVNNGEDGGQAQVIADMDIYVKELIPNIKVLTKLYKNMNLDDDKKV